MRFRLLGVASLVVMILTTVEAVLLLASVVSAATPLSQSYETTEKLPLGAIVSLKDNTTDQVVPSGSSNVENLFGVVIDQDSSLLSLSSDMPTQAQIATSGTVPVLVSDINGAVKKGDHITASPISGVGMRASSNVRVIGIAQGDMTVTKDSKQTYKDNTGEHTVNVGQVPVLVSVAYYYHEPDKTIVPAAIQNIANTLAGKTVNTLPIIISAVVFLIMLIVVSSIIYSMIRSSIVSVGRNPMSQGAIYRDLIQMSALVLGILGVGVIAIFLILTKL